MKTLNEYIEESILDMDEQSADDAVKRDEVWRDFMETYGQLIEPVRSTNLLDKESIKFDNKGRIYFDFFVRLNLDVVPDCIKKYGIGHLNKLVIKNFRGEISKLKIFKCNLIIFRNCQLEFDKPLNCSTIEFENCSIKSLKISNKQPWKEWTMDAHTQQNIVNLYMDKLCPNAKELF